MVRSASFAGTCLLLIMSQISKFFVKSSLAAGISSDVASSMNKNVEWDYFLPMALSNSGNGELENKNIDQDFLN